MKSDEFDKLEHEVKRLKFKNVSNGRIVAHLIHEIAQILGAEAILVSEDGRNVFVGGKVEAESIKERFEHFIKGGSNG